MAEVSASRKLRLRLEHLGNVIGHSNVSGGTDCGFETFASFQSITHASDYES